jgi:ferredoxin
MQELRDLASKLLGDGTVGVVIGYEEGPRGVRPAFVTEAADTGRLVFGPRCVQNLAAYLSPRRGHLARLGKKAVVVKGCDARAVAGLMREKQIARDDVVLLGVRCAGVFRRESGDDRELTAETVADRCARCDCREPSRADYLVGEPSPDPPVATRRAERIAEIDAMSPEGRWESWTRELQRCVRCHACREVCPMCFCERCVADKTVPSWIESSPHGRANLAWHLTRALHQAGRCCDCGECERACPVDIPLGLLNRKLAQVVEERYGYRATDDPAAAAPIGRYDLNDAQEFIL